MASGFVRPPNLVQDIRDLKRDVRLIRQQGRAPIPYHDNFVGDSSIVTLAQAPILATVQVFLGSAYVRPSQYSISGRTLTYNAALTDTSELNIYFWA